MALCICFVAFAAIGQMAGFVHTEIVVDFGEPWTDALWLDFAVGFEYTVGSWILGTIANLDEEGLSDLAFVTIGSIGAIDVYSMYWLDGEDYDHEDNYVCRLGQRRLGLNRWGGLLGHLQHR
jgi:hypothetical protein